MQEEHTPGHGGGREVSGGFLMGDSRSTGAVSISRVFYKTGFFHLFCCPRRGECSHPSMNTTAIRDTSKYSSDLILVKNGRRPCLL